MYPPHLSQLSPGTEDSSSTGCIRHKVVISPPQKEKLLLQVSTEKTALGTGEGLDTSFQKLQPGEMLEKRLSKTNLKM